MKSPVGTRKGKRIRERSNDESSKTIVKRGCPASGSPFPLYPRPTPEECVTVRDKLLALHGFPQEFVQYRNERLKLKPQFEGLIADEFDEKETVMDGLVKTILSQNTTAANSEKAFASLKTAFPTWEDVLAAKTNCIEDTIRCGGLAPTKSCCIKNMLSCLLQKRGKLCMEYLREMSIDEVKAELSLFKGIGPKTVACVLMFNLQHDDFPVDTHVFRIAKSMGWVPSTADIKKTYQHLNQRIPNELKFDLNCLVYTHGKACRNCSNGRKVAKKKNDDVGIACPLLAFSSSE